MAYGGTMQTWNITHTPVLLSTLSVSGHSDTIVISPDGTRLLLFTPSELLMKPYLLFDLLNQKELEAQANLAGGVTNAAVFSPDSSHIACGGWDLDIIDAANGVLLHHLIRFNGWRDPDPLAFSPDSTRLMHLSPEGNIRIFDTEHLPTSVNTKISYPQDHMVTRRDGDVSGGWYCGESRARLIWLPKDMRHVWLAVHRSLVLEQNAREVTILDMSDYLDAVPTARVAWRNGGIRYTSSDAEMAAAYASVGKC
jgi:hypothetical protein